MIRAFEEHHIRMQRELDGFWRFEPDEKEPSLRIKPPILVSVPGCWEEVPGLEQYRGRGTYVKTVELQRDTNIRLVFKGVSHTADVFWDGERIAHHYNAYTPFSALVLKTGAGEHELKVIADNSFSDTSALHIPNDYETWGGIIRPAVLEEIPDTFIEGIKFIPHCEDGVWNANITLQVRNISAEPVF